MSEKPRRRAAILRDITAGGVTIPAGTDFAVVGESPAGYDLEALRAEYGLQVGDRVRVPAESVTVTARG